jgi:hypothetical protein
MSHSVAVRRALMAEKSVSMTYLNFNLTPELLSAETGDVDLDLFPQQKLDLVLLSLGGNTHNIIGIFEHPIPFSIGHETLGAVPPHPLRHFIPYDAFKAVFDDKLAIMFNHADQIHARYPDVPFIYISAPPPIGDEGHIRAYPNKFAGKLHLPFAPPELRIALYEVQCRAYQQQAERHGATFLPAPPEACTPDGFLDLAFANNDPTHGNAAYGRLVLDQISSVLEQVA